MVFVVTSRREALLGSACCCDSALGEICHVCECITAGACQLTWLSDLRPMPMGKTTQSEPGDLWNGTSMPLRPPQLPVRPPVYMGNGNTSVVPGFCRNPRRRLGRWRGIYTLV